MNKKTTTLFCLLVALSASSKDKPVRVVRVLTLASFSGKVFLLQAAYPSGEGSATRVLLLQSSRSSTSTGVRFRLMRSCEMVFIHLFLCLPDSFYYCYYFLFFRVATQNERLYTHLH